MGTAWTKPVELLVILMSSAEAALGAGSRSTNDTDEVPDLGAVENPGPAGWLQPASARATEAVAAVRNTFMASGARRAPRLRTRPCRPSFRGRRRGRRPAPP